jgi:hypothetical protein
MALSLAAKEDLAQFIAANGENYGMYVTFATARGWKIFSQQYLHTWVNRHRPSVKVYRIKHQETMRKATTLDREKRLERAEDALDRIDMRIRAMETDPDADLDTLMKLLELQRKYLQHISQERGEWGKVADSSDTPILTGLLTRMAQGLLSPPTASDPTIIEGEVRELMPVAAGA